MSDATALGKLIEAVEAGGWGGDTAPIWGEDIHTLAYDAFNGSLDAALALHEALLPDITVRIIDHGREYADVGRWNAKINWEHMTHQPNFTAAGPFGHEGQASTPARAWLLAVLRAYRQQLPD